MAETFKPQLFCFYFKEHKKNHDELFLNIEIQ